MCGRFSFSRPAVERLARHLRLTVPDLHPSTNLAPTMNAAVVPLRLGESPRLEAMRWGIIPSWTPQPLINARAESVAQKHTFRRAFDERRCLIVADAFYEWQPGTTPKQPWRFTLPEEEAGLMVLAGIWDHNHDGTHREAFAILTTAANPTVAPCHDRMPVILPEFAWATWLHPEAPEAELLALCRPWAGAMTATPVTPQLNSPRYQGPVELKAPPK